MFMAWYRLSNADSKSKRNNILLSRFFLMAGKSPSEELISFQVHLLSLHAKNGEYCVLWEVSDNIVTISNSFELRAQWQQL